MIISIPKKKLVFHDTLSNGLTLDRDSFKVYKNDSNEVLESNQYEVNITDDKHFTVTIKDVKVLGDDVSKQELNILQH